MLDERPDATPAKHDEYDGPILEIENLSISFFTRLREIPAVMDFSCTVHAGRGDGPRGRVGLRQIHRGARRDAGPRRTAASSAARSSSRAAT
jgi:peptide/nickel transport system ATP-binding protein